MSFFWTLSYVLCSHSSMLVHLFFGCIAMIIYFFHFFPYIGDNWSSALGAPLCFANKPNISYVLGGKCQNILWFKGTTKNILINGQTQCPHWINSSCSHFFYNSVIKIIKLIDERARIKLLFVYIVGVLDGFLWIQRCSRIPRKFPFS